MNIKSEISKIHYNKTENSFYLPLLSFVGFFYEKITSFRNFLYDKNILKSEKVAAYVVSVGNLTTGGVGKTPVVAELARYFLRQKKKVAVISRGYGGKLSSKKVNVISDGQKVFYSATQAGDEPYWFADNLDGACVLTCSNRVKAANFAISNFGVEVIILDDACQHRKIKRDLNIVLVDSEKLFGNGKHLPAGPLRENLNGLNRADKILIMNKTSKRVEKPFMPNLFEESKTHICNVIPGLTYNINTSEALSINSDVTAICAIGQPEQFFEFVKTKFNIVEKITFDDHHSYNRKEISDIQGNIITTEKDAVKLKNFNFNNIYAMRLKLDLDVEGLLKND